MASRIVILPLMPIQHSLSRRTFLLQSALASLALGKFSAKELFAAGKTPWPIAEFSKVYQELNLGFEESADVTAEAGLDGIDCPVRPEGQVLPERSEEHTSELQSPCNLVC